MAAKATISSPAQTARILSGLIGRPAAELRDLLSSDRSFVWVKRKIKAAESEAIERADLPGVYFQEEDRRFYPKRQVASHVLGFVNIDEEGMGGLEFEYNESVRGEAGKLVVMTDARGKRYQSLEQTPQAGADLVEQALQTFLVEAGEHDSGGCRHRVTLAAAPAGVKGARKA